MPRDLEKKRQAELQILKMALMRLRDAFKERDQLVEKAIARVRTYDECVEMLHYDPMEPPEDNLRKRLMLKAVEFATTKRQLQFIADCSMPGEEPRKKAEEAIAELKRSQSD